MHDRGGSFWLEAFVSLSFAQTNTKNSWFTQAFSIVIDKEEETFKLCKRLKTPESYML